MQTQVNAVTIELLQGDITDLATDAIVNAANSALSLGAGVAGAIARKGGPSIQTECNKIGYCEVGGAVITGAGNLAARYVIHAVGPHMSESNARGKLASAARESLALAERNGLTSIALPAISTGIFGYPLEGCAQVMLRVIIDYTFEDLLHLRRVVVCLYDAHAYGIFERELTQQLADL
jgi:O-acetyl-ADP-ribose deacetylase (regulator of RNase III)